MNQFVGLCHYPTFFLSFSYTPKSFLVRIVANPLMACIFVTSFEHSPTGRAIERNSQVVSGVMSLHAPGLAELFVASLKVAAVFTWRCFVFSGDALSIFHSRRLLEIFELTCILIYKRSSEDTENTSKKEPAGSSISYLEP